MKRNFLIFYLVCIFISMYQMYSKISNLKKDKFYNKNLFVSIASGKDDKPEACDLNKLDYKWQSQTTYSDFFHDVRQLNTCLSTYEIKSLYKFLDNKSSGHFDNKRWTSFYYLFLNKFMNCDANSDCLLNQQELTKCFENSDMKPISENLPKSSPLAVMVKEIIFSLDSNKKGGINLSDYILLKKIIIGFNQYHVNGILEKDTFYSALKTTFVDFLIDELDAEIAFKVALNLMLFDGALKISFPIYFEICRLVNMYLAFGVTIGEGFITKDQILRNYETIVYPSKLNYQFLKKYFSIFDDDFSDPIVSSSIDLSSSEQISPTAFDENSLRFEDFTNLEFWANIFTNYTITSSLNSTGFTELITKNKYINPDFLNYLGYSNFEDLSKIQIEPDASSNITEIDFLNGFQASHFSFLETEIQSNKKTISKKLNNNNQLDTRASLKSLFELNLEAHLDSSRDDEKSKISDKQLGEAVNKYFYILDKDKNDQITFEEYITLIKYLKLYQKLNKDNEDQKGIIKSKTVNLINQIVINPKLSIREKTRLQTLDMIPCNYVDFLLFFDFMYAPKIFKPYLINPTENLVEEINIMIVMKILNLYSEINMKKFQGFTVRNGVKFDYEPILNEGLKNKCTTNTKLFANNQLQKEKKQGIKDPLSKAVINGGGMDLVM